jgi:hypothetical protein
MLQVAEEGLRQGLSCDEESIFDIYDYFYFLIMSK